MTEEDLEITGPGVVNVPLAVPVAVAAVPDNIDRVNNIAQKEAALHRAGVTRYKVACVIAEALESVEIKKSDVADASGRYPMISLPNIARRQWAVEQAAKWFGDSVVRDIVAAGPVNIQVTVNHIEIEERIACIRSEN